LNANSYLKYVIKKLKNIAINKEAIIIFTSLTKNILLKEKRSLFFKKTKSNIALNHDEIVVAIGIMINPISLK
jgi:DNA polymerase elongation subunit (family B)